VNCIAMTGEGRNIFNLAGKPTAIEGEDYEFYCPITLDNEGRVNKNQANYFEVMRRCQLTNPNCRTTKTLQQQFSTKQEGNKIQKNWRRILRIIGYFFATFRSMLDRVWIRMCTPCLAGSSWAMVPWLSPNWNTKAKMGMRHDDKY
jgi:hypothetical protein